jgi:predicted ATPase
MLLVLDNCEHVIEAAAALAVDNAQGAPGVRVLATSREPLRKLKRPKEWRALRGLLAEAS